MRHKRISCLLLTLLALGGCASNVPVEIRQELPANPRLTAVAADTRPYQGQRVRWGGTIVSVENKASETWVEVLAKDLDGYGRPEEVDRSAGRFLVRTEQFLDPKIYSADRELTVYGIIEGGVARSIGEKPYTYPLVKAEKFYLWPEYRRYVGDYYDPLYCNDFYWHSALWYGYPPYWYRGYPYWDPFWGPAPYGFCRP